jgi:hypothetical protein
VLSEPHDLWSTVHVGPTARSNLSRSLHNGRPRGRLPPQTAGAAAQGPDAVVRSAAEVGRNLVEPAPRCPEIQSGRWFTTWVRRRSEGDESHRCSERSEPQRRGGVIPRQSWCDGVKSSTIWCPRLRIDDSYAFYTHRWYAQSTESELNADNLVICPRRSTAAVYCFSLSALMARGTTPGYLCAPRVRTERGEHVRLQSARASEVRGVCCGGKESEHGCSEVDGRADQWAPPVSAVSITGEWGWPVAPVCQRQ